MLDPGGRLLDRCTAEEERRRIRNRVNGTVEIARFSDRIQRVADRDLVADDERAPVRPREQSAVRLGVAERRLDEALATWKAVAPDVLALPGVVLVDRLALEVADVDVVEERLLDDRHASSVHRDLRGLNRPAEPRVQADVERERSNLEPEQRRLLVPVLGQRRRYGRVAVDSALVVQHRLGVSGQHEQAHAPTLPPALETPLLEWTRDRPGGRASGQQSPAQGRRSPR